MNRETKKIPAWKLKLRRQGRWCFIAVFFAALLLNFARYGYDPAAALSIGMAQGLAFGFLVMLIFGAIILVRGFAEPPPERPGSK